MNLSPDEVCDQYSQRSVSLVVKDVGDYVVLEGDSVALEFLSALLSAQARFSADSGFQIAPEGPGSIFFGEGANRGIYIHRVD